MSLTFTQIIDTIDDVCGTNSTSFTTAKKTVAVNVALDEALAIIFQQGGMWQFDDKNHTEDPIIITDLVADQRDYHFTTDEQSNVILDVLTEDKVWFEWSAAHLKHYADNKILVINPIIYSEVSVRFSHIEEVEKMGTLDEILSEANYIKDTSGRWIPPKLVATELASI